MAALGLLLVIVVIGAVGYIAGIAWLARLDVRQDEGPPPETVPKPTQSAFVKAPGDIGDPRYIRGFPLAFPGQVSQTDK